MTKLPRLNEDVAVYHSFNQGGHKRWVIAHFDGRSWYESDGTWIDKEYVIIWVALPGVANES